MIVGFRVIWLQKMLCLLYQVTDRSLSFCQLQVSMSEHWEDNPDLFYKIALVIVNIKDW